LDFYGRRSLDISNAKGGTPLMQMDQTMGIDLPLKVLIWQDKRRHVAILQRSGLACKLHGLGGRRADR
jgi:uncharacterized protein (DUF302 family)